MKLFSNWVVVLGLVGSIASIVGLLIFCFSDTVNAIIALSFFCICLLVILVAVISVLFSFVKKGHNLPFDKVSAFTKYETSDGVHIVNETDRVIQSKRVILTQVEQYFKWSGSRMPVITSRLQDVKDVVSADGNNYDCAILKLKRPLVFNETGVIHFHAQMDDVDSVSGPYLDFKVDMPINIIHYRVILKHKPDSYNVPAKFLRRKINSAVPSKYEPICSVEFDKNSKSYEYHLISPDAGYFYRIEWEK